MDTLEKTLLTALAALLLGALLAISGPSSSAFAGERGVHVAQNYESRRHNELNNQRVPLETVIARIQAQCPGRLINARHDARSNRYIVRWETRRQRIISVQADASTGRILSTGGC